MSRVYGVTGAFSFTGAYVAEALLERGERVRTFSRRPDAEHRLARRLEFARLQFDDEAALAADLRGVTTLFNTYWVRFARRDVTWDAVVRNTRFLLRAARAAGVERVVQISVSNASETSRHAYFRAKAQAERALRESGLRWSVVRPTLIFGRGELLLNNIAWTLRRSPVFLLPRGRYATQPVAVEDVVEIALELADGAGGITVDAAGPAAYSFAELVRSVRDAIGVRTPLVRCPPVLVAAVARTAAVPLRDVLVRGDELAALADDVLVSREPPRGKRRLEEWLVAEAGDLGRAFISETRRNWY